ncbi:MAG: protein kinase [Chloroflexi bacterium]|nr:protein kinase [Chloroflexota bacterium]
MEDLTGKQLGSYQIVSQLGEGGMAAVYKAYQPRMDRYVALKILPRYYASDPEFVARFKQEARVIAKLEHPHILPVHDFGEEDGYTFMAMRMVDSGTLTDWILENQPLSLAQIRRIISQVGDALDYAHSKEVVHRDVKPSNILVDKRGNCLLTDFGLAKMVETSVKLTRTGGILGTPAYMSPEQGMGQKIDYRTDMYSLGVILYEMVTGRPPYQAETPMAIVIKHIQAPLPLPYKYNPDIPEALERVILKSLAKDREDRYATTGDFVTALQSATEPATVAGVTAPQLQPQPPVAEEVVELPPAEPALATAVAGEAATVAAVREGSPLAAEPAPMSSQGQVVSPTISKRNKILAGVGGFLLLVVLAVVLIGALDSGDDEADEPDEVDTAVLDNDDFPENDRTEDESPPSLSRDSQSPIEPNTTTQEFLDAAEKAYEQNDLEEVLRQYSDAIDSEPEIAFIHCQRGYVQHDLGEWDRAAVDFDRCARLAAEQGLVDLESEAIGMNALSLFEVLGNEEVPVEDLFRPLNDALENPIAPDWLLCERGERLFSYDFYDEALADFEACQESTDNEYWKSRSQIVIAQIEGDWAFYDEDYETAVDRYSQLTYLDAEAAYPHCLLGFTYIELSDYGSAMGSFKRCSELAEGVDPWIQEWAVEGEVTVQIQQALDRGDLEAALRGYNQAIEVIPDNVWYFCDRGEVFLELGNIPSAREDFQTCFDLSWDIEELHDHAENMLQELGNN